MFNIWIRIDLPSLKFKFNLAVFYQRTSASQIANFLSKSSKVRFNCTLSIERIKEGVKYWLSLLNFGSAFWG